jgi:hypothetical protein
VARESVATARTAAGVTGTNGVDDSSVSTDDETVDVALRAGPEVITSVLGGTVIGELEQ